MIEKLFNFLSRIMPWNSNDYNMLIEDSNKKYKDKMNKFKLKSDKIKKTMEDTSINLFGDKLDELNEMNSADYDFYNNCWDTLIESISNMVVIYTPDYKIKKVNSAFFKFFNIKNSDEIIGTNLYRIFNKNMEYPDGHSCLIKFGKKKVDFFKLYCYRHNSELIFWVHDIPLKSSTGENVAVLRVYTKSKAYNKRCVNCMEERSCQR